MTIKKIALLVDPSTNLTFELQEFELACQRAGIDVSVFDKSEPILDFQPDCVIVTSPQDAKLTPYPTYGLMNLPRDEYLELPRFFRNMLTYDGYLCSSPRTEQMLKDVLFGARKLGASVLNMDFYPGLSAFQAPTIKPGQQEFVIFEPNYTTSRFKGAINHLLDKFPLAKLATFSLDGVDRHASRFILMADCQEVTKVLQQFGIAVFLNGGDQQEQYINPAMLKLAASSVATITLKTDMIEKCFGDNFYYIPAETYSSSLHQVIQVHLKSITADIPAVIEKTKAAHDVFVKNFAVDNLLTAFLAFHDKTLVDKGYRPNPDPAREQVLPSVTYIMRTGGKHRPFLERALDCLVAQQYPDMRVIFVTHVKVPFIDDIISQYPSIKFKVLESIKSRRSEAIRDGMAAVETDLFGLFDDDDELFPNHVRSLVRTMQYHSGRDWRGQIGMVYSGSIHADDTYPVFERVEFHDNLLVDKKEKRAIEHFRLYSSNEMSQHSWFMPNGWLARTSLIDEEILTDPGLDTCEDLYFELQFAQRALFAFTFEVTAIHHFHHLGNSTIDDSYKHLPDTQRIALRNFSRVFPPDIMYDTVYNLVSRKSSHDDNQILYQDFKSGSQACDYPSPFYPSRHRPNASGSAHSSPVHIPRQRSQLMAFVMLPFKLIGYINKFAKLDKYKRIYYYNKFTASVRQYGFWVTLTRITKFFESSIGPVPSLMAKSNSSTRGWFFRVKMLFKMIVPGRLVSLFRKN